MRRTLGGRGLWGAILCAAGCAHGALEWNGALMLDSRLRLNEPYEIERQEYRLSLGLAATPGERTRFLASLWLRYLQDNGIAHVADLQALARVLPLDLALREACLDAYGVGLKGLDLRLGRQRIAWGRGDRINPTDNFDPDDLEDIWDFGRHLASDAISLRYYLGDFSLQTVYTPLFRPAVLPPGEWLDAVYRLPALPEQYAAFITLEQPQDSVLLPDPRPVLSSSGGLRLQGRAAAVDFSVSYAYCRQDIPVPAHATVTPRGTLDLSGPLPAAVTAELVFPRMHVAGADAAWHIGDVGMWAEAAVFFSEKVITQATVSQEQMVIPDAVRPLLAFVPDLNAALNGQPVPVDTPLDGTPYVKWVAGADYTFRCNLYLNVQYARGLAHEYGGSLEDYFVLDSRWSLLEERLQLGLLNSVLEVRDWREFSTGWAALWMPAVTWKPLDNLALAAGVRLIWGGNNSTFGRMAGRDHAWVRAEYSF